MTLYSIGRVFIVLWHAVTKYIFRRLNKQWHQCFIDLITYNITTVLSTLEWHFIRDHHLVYINSKYISYLSLSIKVFDCNLFLTKFNWTSSFINTFLDSAYQMIKKNQLLPQFCCLFFLVFSNTPIPPVFWMPSKVH